MRSRFSLPSLGVVALPAGPPSVDQARTALGGRVSTEGGAGTCVRVTMSRGPAIGVLVCLLGEERDVWIGEGRFVRVKASEVASLVDEDESLARVSEDARRFGRLVEGERVTCLDRKSAEHAGVLVEKCRYGALVSVGTGSILAVSFQRIWPAAVGGAPT